MVAVETGPGGVKFDWLAEIDVHQAANLFPLLEGDAFAELVADIKAHGLRELIAFTPDGQLLDGRNRYRACRSLGHEVDESFRKTVGDEPWAYVISTNLHRRHLSDNQRKMIGGRIAERYAGQRRSQSADADYDHGPPTQRQAAGLLNVSKDGIERAHKIVKDGIKPLQHLVDEDRVKVSTAERIAKRPKDAQEEFVQRVNSGVHPSRAASEKPAPLHKRLESSPDRHKFLLASSFESVISVLNGLGLVLDGATSGLDPSVTDEEAAHLLRSFSKAGVFYRKALTVLKTRTEERK